MAEVIRAATEMVEKLGLGAAILIAILFGIATMWFAASWVVKWNRQLVDEVVGVHKSSIELSARTIERNTVAMNANTESNLKVQSSVDKLCDKFGSDPMNTMCKAQETLDAKERQIQAKAKEFGLTAEQAAMALDTLTRIKDIQGTLADQAEESKKESPVSHKKRG